jgi:hypothetical protein
VRTHVFGTVSVAPEGKLADGIGFALGDGLDSGRLGGQITDA